MLQIFCELCFFLRSNIEEYKGGVCGEVSSESFAEPLGQHGCSPAGSGLYIGCGKLLHNFFEPAAYDANDANV